MSPVMLREQCYVAQAVLLLASTSSATNRVEDGEHLRAVFNNQLCHYCTSPMSTWIEGSDPCESSWAGITCEDRDGLLRVTEVRLAGAGGLSGTVDLPALQLMGALEYFDISSNELTLTEESLDLSKLPTGLLDFSVFENKFDGGVNFTNIPRDLRNLDLDTNSFTGRVDLSNLPKNLRTLYLHGNQFTGPLDTSHLPISLEVMNVFGNQFTGALNLENLPHGTLHFTASGNDFTTIHLPESLPSGLFLMKLQPRLGWMSACFTRTLEVLHSGYRTDIPSLSEQRLCPEPEPTTLTLPAPTPDSGKEGEEPGHVSVPGEGGNTTNGSDCRLVGVRCWIFGAILMVPAIGLIMLGVGMCIAKGKGRHTECKKQARPQGGKTSAGDVTRLDVVGNTTEESSDEDEDDEEEPHEVTQSPLAMMQPEPAELTPVVPFTHDDEDGAEPEPSTSLNIRDRWSDVAFNNNFVDRAKVAKGGDLAPLPRGRIDPLRPI